MRYVDFKGERISALGAGTMRLPIVEGDSSHIDKRRAFELIDTALELGVNYFDTAWGYHGGTSEPVVGEALVAHERGSFFLASKFPSYNVGNFGQHETIFAEQLRRCRVEFFDFYLLHNVNEQNIGRYLAEDEYGTVAFFERMREAGTIRHLGFSTHADFDTFETFMRRFGEKMEFCQIEVNYLDWGFQDAERKVRYCAEHGVPVWVMEPLRGGALCTLTPAQMAPLEALCPGRSAHEWAFAWLQTMLPDAVVLSGMGSVEMLRDNVRIFSQNVRLNSAELDALDALARAMTASIGLACTGCRYCTPHCPQGLDIPTLLSLYNESCSRGESVGFIAPMRVRAMDPGKRPGCCIACGACRSVCPQNLAIPDALAELARAVEHDS